MSGMSLAVAHVVTMQAWFCGPDGEFAEVTRRLLACGVTTTSDVSASSEAQLALVWVGGPTADYAPPDGQGAKRLSSLPLVAVMADVTLSSVDQAYQLGAHGYYALTEPIAVLRAVLRSAIEVAVAPSAPGAQPGTR